MKESETGLISENKDEADVISSHEFMDALMYKYNHIRIVVARYGENFMFESTIPSEIEDAKELLNEMLTERGD